MEPEGDRIRPLSRGILERMGMAELTIAGAQAPAKPRLVLVDIARGVAILAMVVYHLAWDLGYFGLISTDVTTDPPWMLFQRSILSSFLLLVGVGLVLGHGAGIRWPAFWRRMGIIVAAALAVTLGTYWMFPEYFVFFGVLHAIALFSLLALPFLRLRLGLVLAAAAFFLVLPLLFTDPLFNARPLAWIGLWTAIPATNDIVPVFPWFGVVLLGVAGTRLLQASPLIGRVAAWQFGGPISRGLIICGRWSLLIYLLHQPLMLGGLTLLMELQSPVLQPEVLSRAESFVQSCRSTCGAAGGGADYCQAYCSCALEQVDGTNLWALVETPGASQDEAVADITRLCTAMAE